MARFAATQTIRKHTPTAQRGGCLLKRPTSRAPAPGSSLSRFASTEERMRQYGCEQEGTKASSRRDADAARDTRGRRAPRRPRPRAGNVRGGRATRAHVSRSSRRNRSDVPRSHVTPARIRSRARCRSRTASVSRSIVSSSPCAWDGAAVARRRKRVHAASSAVQPSRRCQFGQQTMEPLWSPAVATGCDRLPIGAHGKGALPPC